MIEHKTMNRLEGQLSRLVDGMLARKGNEIDFLIGLNRLDDILIKLRQGESIDALLSQFLSDHRYWLDPVSLNAGQKKRLGQLLKALSEELSAKDDSTQHKLADEVREWSRSLGQAPSRLILKAPKEQLPSSDRFQELLKRELEEMEMLLTKSEHLMTCLDDVLSSAESKTDVMYRHLAASIIYFLKTEGYKTEPYVKRLHQTEKDI